MGFVAVVIGYLLGSFPSAYIVARLRKGIDIRDFESGNVGAGNVHRNVGLKEAFIVGIADIAKGAGAILIAQAMDVSQPWVLGAGFSTLLGHNFPVYIGFRGGKGSAALVGIFLVLTPIAMLISVGILLIPLLITRNNAFSLFIGFVFLPLIIWLSGGSLALVFYSLGVLIFLIARSFSTVKNALREATKGKATRFKDV
jgi:glycerol-3-phosphate acyltransferase PlsY